MSKRRARGSFGAKYTARAATQNNVGTQASRAGADALTQRSAGWAERLEHEFLQEVLTATYWFDAGERGKPYAMSIKFSGRRIGITGKPQAGDHFVQIETVNGIVPTSGPVSITTRVSGINPGEWMVTADPAMPKTGRSTRPYPKEYDGDPRRASWRPWPIPRRPISSGRATPLKTQLAPFASIPGINRPAWPALVGLGVLIGLAVQALLVARAGLEVRAALAVSLSACIAGYVGAKAWYLILQRRGFGALATEGLCIQGFLLGAAIVLVAGFALLQLPIGRFLDAATPGLFFGMAFGRPGCIFAGCCSGRPTASPWGMWASDRRLGIRRIPTQLLEAFGSLAIGVTALIIIFQYRVAVPGALFIGAIAAYTLCRQLLLPFRAEPRKSSIGRPLTMVAAGLVLTGDILLSAVS